jgi:hypothetical protein
MMTIATTDVLDATMFSGYFDILITWEMRGVEMGTRQSCHGVSLAATMMLYLCITTLLTTLPTDT